MMTEIIGQTRVQKGDVKTYMALPEIARKFQWTVGGGKILKGQGTPEIQVDWHLAGPGSIELDITTEEGYIDAIFIGIDVHRPAAERDTMPKDIKKHRAAV